MKLLNSLKNKKDKKNENQSTEESQEKNEKMTENGCKAKSSSEKVTWINDDKVHSQESRTKGLENGRKK